MKNDFFDSGGVRIHFAVDGSGPPIVLVHGFAANLHANWQLSGWFDTLRPLRQVIALDCRGHGESDKPHDPALYGIPNMASDVIRLMDHLGVERGDLFGYSMGSAIALRAMVDHPQRFTSVVLGGTGVPRRRGARIASAMRAQDGSAVRDDVGRGFRTIAERLGGDLEALAAMQEAPRTATTPEELGGVTLPVLIVNGEDDRIIGDVDALAAMIPTSRVVKIAGKDHLTVVPDAQFKQTVVEFLNEPR